MLISTYAITGLGIILLAVLVLPFIFKPVEHNLEIFLLAMGILSVSVAGLWCRDLLIEAITSPVSIKHPIVEVVFLSGLIFRFLNKKIGHSINKLVDIFGLKLFIFLLIVVLGIFSSVITAIIASLLLAQVISELKLDKKTEIKLVVTTCFAIGLGAALTPVGEPLSTIAVAKLNADPYNAGFFFLFNQLWWLIIPGIVSMIPDMLLKGTSNASLVRNCRSINPTAYIVTTANFSGQIPELMKSGANEVLLPYSLAGKYLVQTIQAMIVLE